MVDVVEENEAVDLEEEVREEEVDEGIVERVPAVDEDELKTPTLPEEVGEGGVRSLVMELEVVVEVGAADVAAADRLVLRVLVGVDRDVATRRRGVGSSSVGVAHGLADVQGARAHGAAYLEGPRQVVGADTVVEVHACRLV